MFGFNVITFLVFNVPDSAVSLHVLLQIFIVKKHFPARNTRIGVGRLLGAGSDVFVQRGLIRELLSTTGPQVGAGKAWSLELGCQHLDPLPLLVVLTVARTGVRTNLGLRHEEKTVAALSHLPGLTVQTAVLGVLELLQSCLAAHTFHHFSLSDLTSLSRIKFLLREDFQKLDTPG